MKRCVTCGAPLFEAIDRNGNRYLECMGYWIEEQKDRRMKRSYTLSMAGLAVFVAVVVIAGIILGIDLWLLATNRETITEHVFADWRGVALVGLVALAPVGLWVHFKAWDGRPTK